MLLQQQ